VIVRRPTYSSHFKLKVGRGGHKHKGLDSSRSFLICLFVGQSEIHPQLVRLRSLLKERCYSSSFAFHFDIGRCLILVCFLVFGS